MRGVISDKRKSSYYMRSPPLFIGGFPSGGTDLLRSILNANPSIYLNGEMPFLYHLPRYGYDVNTVFTNENDLGKFRELLLKLDIWNNLQNIDGLPDLNADNSLVDVLRFYFSEEENLIWGNKTPQNSENLAGLEQVFPDANFLIIARDVRDVCLSWRNKWGKNIYLCSHKWRFRMQIAKNVAAELPPERIHFIRYEDLLTNTREVTLGICKFLNVEWSDRMLEHHLHTPVILDGKINYGTKLILSNTEKWKSELSKKKINRIEEIALETMLIFDYQPVYAKHSKELTQAGKLSGKLQDLMAVLFVGNRASQKNTLGDRFKVLLYEIKKQLRNFR